MKLFIPAIGDRLTLVEPWTFSLYLERRNIKFAVEHKLVTPSQRNDWYGVLAVDGDYESGFKKVDVTLPAGTVVECDRIYIRTFNKSAVQEENDFDSITWKVMKNGKAVTKQRFWVKLPDCYAMEFDLAPDALYRDRVKAFKVVHDT